MERWCGRKGVARGELLTLEQTWSLAQAWYYDRLDPDFRGRTADEAQAIFRALGFRSPFWYLETG